MSPKDVLMRWIEAFNNADSEAIAECYDESAVNHQVNSRPIQGKQAIKEKFHDEFNTAKMTCIVENIFEDGDWVILEWRDPLGLQGCGFFQVINDKIVSQRGYWDRLSFLKQHNLPINDISHPLFVEQMEVEQHNFSTPPDNLDGMGYDRMDLFKPGEDQNHDLSPSLYKMLYLCVRELFFQTDDNAAVETALGYIGRGMKVSRSYIFLKEADGTYSNTHEWCAQGIRSEKDALQHIPPDEEYIKWLDMIQTRRGLIVSDIRTLDYGIYKELERQGIKSIAVFPIWKDNELCGFVGFDDCDKMRVWLPDEIQTLHTLTGMITSIQAKMWLREEIDTHNTVQEIILNSMTTAIHVTDLETKNILFANSSLLRLYGNRPLIGRKCFEALENRGEKCVFCPVEHLRYDPGKSYQWDHYCEAVERHLRITGCVIPWTGGKLAHLEYAEDVTELRNSQNQLKLLASTDTLTNTLNRHSFFDEAKNLFDYAAKNNKTATLAFIDLDGLKSVNDAHGHTEGDEFIRSVVKALRENMREGDIIGRFGGDEFTILLENCAKENAEKIIRMALKKLADMSLDNKCSYSFSYGLAENMEVLCKTSGEQVDELLKIADKRMFDQKKLKKQYS